VDAEFLRFFYDFANTWRILASKYTVASVPRETRGLLAPT
jgi:hypothetical protein